MASSKKILDLVKATNHFNQTRYFSLSRCLEKNRSTAVKKTTPNRTQPLTYEEAQKPEMIGVRKSWNSWNSSKFFGEKFEFKL